MQNSNQEPALPARILIVEDGKVLAKNMKMYLSRGASDVRIAADAAQALALLQSFVPDVLIVDQGLPDMDGLRLYAEIVRRRRRNIDCILMTGNPSAELVEIARKLGVSRVVCKPFPCSELQRLLLVPPASALERANAPAGAAADSGNAEIAGEHAPGV